jgi:endoglucanase
MRDPAAVCLVACSLLLGACGGFEVPAEDPRGSGGATNNGPRRTRAICAADDESDLPMTHPQGIRAMGNHIEDENGTTLFLRGVNRSGSEYRCIQNQGFFDGPCDEASVRAMKSWGVNSVRVPLNESCWLAINEAPDDLSGQNYKAAIQSYVFLLHKHDMVPILELHWSHSGDAAARSLAPLPNVDHSQDFWSDVASTFKDDSGVILEPFNEPFPDRNQDTTAAWQCWRDGCTQSYDDDRNAKTPEVVYEAAGMQAMVTSIRDAGATQLILLGGVRYSNFLTQWRDFRPTDPLENLGVAWHIYDFNDCDNATCYESAPLELAQDYPLVATEIGQQDCEGDFISPLMSFLDQYGSGYLAWSWNQGAGSCAPGEDAALSLVADYETAEPHSEYARTFRDHVLEMTP